MRTKERHVGHMSFLSQEGVQCEIWIGGLLRKHSYRRKSPQRKMELIIHPNEWV
jgi:hypothetical protein